MPTLDGPRGPIPYERDAWGYPDIHVRDDLEAAWARGWFHGHDRQAQVRLAWMVAQGRMMEVLGDVPLSRALDRATRSLGLARDLDAQVAQLDDRTRGWIDAYCAGFDAGCAAAGRPWILTLLRIPSLPWRPRDVVLTYRVLGWFGLSSLTQSGRVTVAQLQAHGLDADQIAFLVGPEGTAGFDPSAADGLRWAELITLAHIGMVGGSNAFAVAPSRSGTGGALLMAEFHMEIGRQPPVMYAASTRTPDGRVYQGMGLPGWPFVSAGRNRNLGWAYTFGHADHIALTAETCRGGARKVGDGWEPLVRRDEVVRIRGRRAPETWTYWDAGPTIVVGDASIDGVHPALRWYGLERSGHDLNRCVALLDATTAREAADVHVGFETVSTALVAADRHGGISWALCGRVPAEPTGWGVQPGGRAGDPDWREPPRVDDPADGLLVSANEGHSGFTAFPEPIYRNERIRERLSERRDWTPRGLLDVSYDAHDRCAARLLGVWGPSMPDDPRARELVAWAASQGTRLTPEGRVHAARFHALHRAMVHEAIRHRLGEEVAVFCLEGMEVYLELQPHLDDVLALAHPEWLDRDVLPGLLAAAWPRALVDAENGDVSGPIHARFKNPLTRGYAGWLGVDTAPLPLPGTPTSPFQARQLDVYGERIVTGPAFHVVMDLGSELALYNIAGGASERWRGPGYGKGIAEWLAGDVVPLPGNR